MALLHCDHCRWEFQVTPGGNQQCLSVCVLKGIVTLGVLLVVWMGWKEKARGQGSWRVRLWQHYWGWGAELIGWP